jgi:hypothetical protein
VTSGSRHSGHLRLSAEAVATITECVVDIVHNRKLNLCITKQGVAWVVTVGGSDGPHPAFTASAPNLASALTEVRKSLPLSSSSPTEDRPE